MVGIYVHVILCFVIHWIFSIVGGIIMVRNRILVISFIAILGNLALFICFFITGLVVWVLFIVIGIVRCRLSWSFCFTFRCLSFCISKICRLLGLCRRSSFPCFFVMGSSGWICLMLLPGSPVLMIFSLLEVQKIFEFHLYYPGVSALKIKIIALLPPISQELLHR